METLRRPQIVLGQMQARNIYPDALETGYCFILRLSCASLNASNAKKLGTKIVVFMTLSLLLSQHALICGRRTHFCDDGGSPLTNRT